MRCLYQEAERRNEGLLQEMNEIKLNKDRLKNDYDMLKHEKNQSVFHSARACTAWWYQMHQPSPVVCFKGWASFAMFLAKMYTDL